MVNYSLAATPIPGLHPAILPEEQVTVNIQVPAAEMAYMLMRLGHALGARPRDVRCIGFSLGGDVCSLFAKHFSLNATTEQKIGQIMAVDPNYLCFGRPNTEYDSFNDHLAPHDSALVITLHTDDNEVDFPFPVSHYDHFINNGTIQPG